MYLVGENHACGCLTLQLCTSCWCAAVFLLEAAAFCAAAMVCVAAAAACLAAFWANGKTEDGKLQKHDASHWNLEFAVHDFLKRPSPPLGVEVRIVRTSSLGFLTN